MRVLITGATGFIGTHLARRWIVEGAQVSAFRRMGRRGDARAASAMDWHDADLRTYGAVSNAVKAIRPDIVYHLAAEGVTDPFLSPDAAIRANLYGTLHLLRAVDGKAPVIVARTPGERDGLNVYAASKSAAWEFCRMYRRTHGWPVIGAMLFQVYGPGQSPKSVLALAIAAALRGDDFPMTPGGQQRDWIHVDDVVESLVILGRHQERSPIFEMVEIGTGQTRSVREVVEAVYRMIGGAGRPLIGALPVRPGEVMIQCADADRTEALAGWRARVAFDDGLRDTLEWTRQWLSQSAR